MQTARTYINRALVLLTVISTRPLDADSTFAYIAVLVLITVSSSADSSALLLTVISTRTARCRQHVYIHKQSHCTYLTVPGPLVCRQHVYIHKQCLRLAVLTYYISTRTARCRQLFASKQSHWYLLT